MPGGSRPALASLRIEHMFVYFSNGHVCSCRDAVTVWCPTGYRHRCPRVLVPALLRARCRPSGSCRFFRSWPGCSPAGGLPRGGTVLLGPASTPDTLLSPAPGTSGPSSQPQLSGTKPDAGIDEPAALAASGHIVSGVLVRSGRLAGARVSSSGRAGGRSRPSCHRPSPWLGRSLAKRRCDTARDRRSRLSRPGHSRATR